nr:MAG TPA: hypothetical protein [Caudoviricetes sp.]
MYIPIVFRSVHIKSPPRYWPGWGHTGNFRRRKIKFFPYKLL